jgi:hypothetical protein
MAQKNIGTLPCPIGCGSLTMATHSSGPLDRIGADAVADISNPLLARGRGVSAKRLSNDRRFRWTGRRSIRLESLTLDPNWELTGPSETVCYLMSVLVPSSEGQGGAVSWTTAAWRVRGVKEESRRRREAPRGPWSAKQTGVQERVPVTLIRMPCRYRSRGDRASCRSRRVPSYGPRSFGRAPDGCCAACAGSSP